MFTAPRKESPKSDRNTVEIILTEQELKEIAQLANQCGLSIEQTAEKLARESLARRVRRRRQTSGGFR